MDEAFSMLALRDGALLPLGVSHDTRGPETLEEVGTSMASGRAPVIATAFQELKPH